MLSGAAIGGGEEEEEEEEEMAKYDPPQPLWKRIVAAILDFVLAFAVFAILIFEAFGTGRCPLLGNRLFSRCVSLNWLGVAAIVAFTVGYFVVLGRNGGTVFQRLFGMTRASDASEMVEVVRLILRSDEQRRVQICRRGDGRFSFFEEQRLRDLNGEPRWRLLTSFERLSDSMESAELQARAAIGWLGVTRQFPLDEPQPPTSVT
jgi:hypothetical protein